MSKLEQLLAERAAIDESIAAKKLREEKWRWLLCALCASSMK